ncbi:hypothetical protein VTL71DRAFT_13122 [Oculimacula yallundae]|uniref:Protein kinase domain-containing protein n=1 Tax=Oculimacula yallundae TaxID=86028 RepID=A0ABR4CPG6_9HELO
MFAITVICGLRGRDLEDAMGGIHIPPASGVKIDDSCLTINEATIKEHFTIQRLVKARRARFTKQTFSGIIYQKRKQIQVSRSGMLELHWAKRGNTKAKRRVPRLAKRVSSLRHEKITANKRGQQHYRVFYWADVGNLRDFWGKFPRIVSASLVRDIIWQLQELAEVLAKLHNPEGTIHSRHGDIKSENIRRVPGIHESRIGLFKMSDLGSAKHHTVVTRLRGRTMGGKWATKIYGSRPINLERLRACTIYVQWRLSPLNG